MVVILPHNNETRNLKLLDRVRELEETGTGTRQKPPVQAESENAPCE